MERVTDDLDRRLHLNTPVSSLMQLLNDVTEFARDGRTGDEPYIKEAGTTLALLLQPLAPHVSEELWESLGGDGSVLEQPWPVADGAWLVEEEIEMVVQVNGKVRGHVRLAAGAPEAAALARALEDPRIAAHLTGRSPAKVIYLPGRLLNLVVR
jgi:leucyl-tRNA synthetase